MEGSFLNFFLFLFFFFLSPILENNSFLFLFKIALWTRYFPIYHKFFEILERGDIGTINTVHSDIGFNGSEVGYFFFSFLLVSENKIK